MWIVLQLYPLVSCLLILAFFLSLGLWTLPVYKQYRVVNASDGMSYVEEIPEPVADPIWVTICACIVFFLAETTLHVVLHVRDAFPRWRCSGEGCAALLGYLAPPIVWVDVASAAGCVLFLAVAEAGPFFGLMWVRALRIPWFLKHWPQGRAAWHVVRTHLR